MFALSMTGAINRCILFSEHDFNFLKTYTSLLQLSKNLYLINTDLQIRVNDNRKIKRSEASQLVMLRKISTMDRYRTFWHR